MAGFLPEGFMGGNIVQNSQEAYYDIIRECWSCGERYASHDRYYDRPNSKGCVLFRSFSTLAPYSPNQLNNNSYAVKCTYLPLPNGWQWLNEGEYAPTDGVLVMHDPRKEPVRTSGGFVVTASHHPVRIKTAPDQVKLNVEVIKNRPFSDTVTFSAKELRDGILGVNFKDIEERMMSRILDDMMNAKVKEISQEPDKPSFEPLTTERKIRLE